jgi:alcohol dehydrogenase
MISTTQKTMKAVVLKDPHQVVIEDRPFPIVQDPTDAIIKVHQSGLCGESL